MENLKAPGIEEEVRRAVEVLRRGGIILYPTDTIWGLGCDGTNPEAVRRIYGIKKRSNSKSMISLVDSVEALKKIVAEEFVRQAADLMRKFKEPVTVIYSGPEGLAKELIAEDGTAGIRITEEAFSNLLCREFGKPLVSTSANISGEASPQNFHEISDEIKEAADYVVSYGQEDTAGKKPSRIVRLKENGETEIIR